MYISTYYQVLQEMMLRVQYFLQLLVDGVIVTV